MDLAAHGTAGTFDAVGPANPLTMGDVIDTCRAAGGGVAVPVWVDEQFLLAHGALPWMELPLWLPARLNGLLERRGAAAAAAGLRHRPLAAVVADTAAWAAAAGGLVAGVGLGRAKEATLLEGWESWTRA